jgi:hypothetical protein
MRCLSLGVLLCTAALAQDVGTTKLKDSTLEAFRTYVQRAESRIDRQVKSSRFLWVEQSPEYLSRVKSGEVVVAAMVNKGDFDIPDGMIHHWIGAAFIPGATLAKTMAVMQDYNRHKEIYKPEVMDSRLVSRNGNDFKIYLRLLKKKVITVVLNTYHDVHYYPAGTTRVHTRSYTTRIAEVKEPGKETEKEFAPGKDHGFMWRLNTYWRFEEREGGVYIECEAISLSRDVPTGLGWLITPIVRSLPRESLTGTLTGTRDALK